MTPVTASGPLRRRDSLGGRQTDGCIVTLCADGREWSQTEPGLVLQALARIVGPIPIGGADVLSICTPRSIYRDMTVMPVRYGGGRKTMIDPWSYERKLLAKIGRLDLMPDYAYPYKGLR